MSQINRPHSMPPLGCIVPVLAIACLLALCGKGQAQTMEFQDVDGRRGVQTGYNRFTDQGVILTKRDFVQARAGKGNFLDPNANGGIVEISAAAFFKGERPTKEITEIIFAVFPDTATATGRLAQSGSRNRLYFAPESKLIAIADGERIELGHAAKTFSLDALGRYDGAAYVLIPIEDFKRITDAKKLEMAIGPVELKLEKRHRERLRSLAQAIEAIH
jgi:hypothetical protein